MPVKLLDEFVDLPKENHILTKNLVGPGLPRSEETLAGALGATVQDVRGVVQSADNLAR